MSWTTWREISRPQYYPKGVFNNKNMTLVGALSRKNKGKNLAEILNLDSINIPIFENIETALLKTDFYVLVEYIK